MLAAKGMSGGAVLAIRSTDAKPFGLAAFFGMDARTGWFARARYAESEGRQALPWVGNSWDIEKGEGPYVVSDALAATRGEVVSAMHAELDRLIAERGL